MKRKACYFLMTISVAVMTGCTAEDPFESYYSNNYNGMNNGGNMSGGSSATTGELATFDIAIDKTSTEPSSTASAFFPDDEDVLENNEFTTLVTIDLSAPSMLSAPVRPRWPSTPIRREARNSI